VAWDAVLWHPPETRHEGLQCPSDIGGGETLSPLTAGEYLLTLVATSGPKSGAQVTGPMILKKAGPKDRSPRTGEVASISYGEEPQFYGAAALDWSRVAAPVLEGEPPPANSLDPIYPGVLVRSDGATTLILIGTLSNFRNGEAWLDGAGIGLTVTAASSNRVRGTWDAWGLAVGGGGRFCIDPAPSSTEA